MAIKTISQLKSVFETDDVPTQTDYVDVFDSSVNRAETAEQTMSGQLTLPATKVSSTAASYYFNESDAASNSKLWRIAAESSVLSFESRTDADVLTATGISIARDGGVTIGNLSTVAIASANCSVMRFSQPPRYNNSGAAAISGTATLSGGTVTINTTAVKNNSHIDVMPTSNSNLGTHYIATVTSGASFQVQSTNVLDASGISWKISDRL